MFSKKTHDQHPWYLYPRCMGHLTTRIIFFPKHISSQKHLSSQVFLFSLIEHQFATNLSNPFMRINNCNKLTTLHRFSSSSLIDNAMSLTYCSKIYCLVLIGRKIPLTSPNLFLLLSLGM